MTNTQLKFKRLVALGFTDQSRIQKPALRYDGIILKTILSPTHREITIIELQSLVVFGCTALLFMVGTTASTHDREAGWNNFLFVYTE